MDGLPPRANLAYGLNASNIVMNENKVDLPPLEERPLVTFALFAYNQEKYIREAVEGAFAQTYEPLEIILSDDCSTDRTFEIMREMVAEYRGTHKLTVRQSPTNRGLGLHIKDVVDLAQGEVIVVAAGDDVSLPHRTFELVASITRERSAFAASNYNSMDESGTILETNLQNDYSGNYIWTVIDAPPAHFASGAAAAYRIDFARGALNAAQKTLIAGKLFNEDILFAAYAVALGEFPSNVTQAPLVNYRIVSTSLSNFRRRSDTWAQEWSLVQREIFRSSARLACLCAILEMAETHPQLSRNLRLKVIRSDMRRSEVELLASEHRFHRRLFNLRHARDMTELKVFLARLPGLRFLTTLRFARSAIAGLTIVSRVT